MSFYEDTPLSESGLPIRLINAIEKFNGGKTIGEMRDAWKDGPPNLNRIGKQTWDEASSILSELGLPVPVVVAAPTTTTSSPRRRRAPVAMEEPEVTVKLTIAGKQWLVGEDTVTSGPLTLTRNDLEKMQEWMDKVSDLILPPDPSES